MIAHRLETAVAYSDLILVMDKGGAVEFASPINLLIKREQDQTVTAKGLFAKMVKTLPEQQQERII